MYRRWELPHGLAAGVGGSAGGNIGVVYSNRNSNNPASVKADITVNAGGFVAWRTRLWRMPVLLRWQTSMPLTGVFFSPEYDELYYEIYLGNHSGLAHWGWPGNLFRWDNLVTADLDFSNTRLRLGFRSRIYSTQVNNLTTRIFSYAFVLGVTGDWMSLSPAGACPTKMRRGWSMPTEIRVPFESLFSTFSHFTLSYNENIHPVTEFHKTCCATGCAYAPHAWGAYRLP